MTTNSYQNREITIQFTLNGGETFDGESNILTIKNARCHISFQSFTGLSGIDLSLTIWGLSKQYLATLGCMGMVAIANKEHRVKIWVEGSVIFEGVIATSYADFTQMPEVPLIIKANPMTPLTVKSYPGFSAQGPNEVADIIESICSAIGLSFENYGVTGVINNPYFEGNALMCIYSAAASVDAVVEITINKVSIWPKGVKRDNVVLKISSGNGLLGYPAWAPVGLLITTVYTDLAVPGRYIELKTDLPNASGEYQIIGVEHSLSSEVFGGPWQTTMYVNNEQT